MGRRDFGIGVWVGGQREESEKNKGKKEEKMRGFWV